MAPQFKLFPQQIKLRVAIRYRAGRPGAELQRPHLARPRQNADRRPDGQFVTWHGGDGGSQDGIAHDPELSLIAAAALPAGDFTRAVKRLAAQRLGERRHTSSWSFLRSRVRGQCAAHLVWNRPSLISLRAKRSS